MSTDFPCGFYPFWFWNDRLTVEEIRWQIQQMAEQGVRGFFVHPRQGLKQPYLSEAFFEMMDAAIAAAGELGLSVHLYDEFPYPTGVAGGEVVLGNPHFYATDLIQQVYPVDGKDIRVELPRGKVLSVMAYPLEGDQVIWNQGIDLISQVGMALVADSYRDIGLTRYNQKRYFASQPTPVLETRLPAGRYQIYASVQVEIDHFKYWGHYTDVLNPEAVQMFFKLTHERYRQRYSEHFGKTILSIFSDEIQPVWSDRIPAAFAQTYGYPLEKFLPALQDCSHPDHLKVKSDLYQLKYRLFCETFEQPLANWCRANGLAYTGEKPSLRMSQLRFMDIPGCEPGHTKAGASMDLMAARLRRNAKATASAAYLYGKQGSLDECYHSMGWSGTLQDAKLIADSLLLLGIRYLVPHGFFYSTHALKKHDAPPTFFFQMPYWPFFGKLSEHVNRIAGHFAGTHIAAQVLLFEPSSGLPSHADQGTYEALQALLMENHIDFLMTDTDTLVENRIENGRLLVRDLLISAIILPPMQVYEASLLDWLAAFEKAGGTVLRCEAGFEAEALLSALQEKIGPHLGVQSGGKEIAAVQVVHRISKDKNVWFLLNTSAETYQAEFAWTGDVLDEILLEDQQPTRLEQTSGRYQRTIHPFKSFMLRTQAAPLVFKKLPAITVQLQGPAHLRPLCKNLLRMYDWDMKLIDGTGQRAIVPAVPISDQLAAGDFKFSPRIYTFFGHAPELDWPQLHVQYDYVFENQYEGPVELVMEPGSLVGLWKIQVNDSEPFGQEGFSPTASFIRGCYGKDISSAMQKGQNIIRVDLETDQPGAGLLNALYLAGDFGVIPNPVCLTPPVENGEFEGYTENRLPFYSGVIEYTLNFDLQAVPTGPQVLIEYKTPVPFDEACEISVNGSEWQALLWQPRRLETETRWLKSGQNTLRVRVYTTLIRAFEGQWFDAVVHRYRSIQEK